MTSKERFFSTLQHKKTDRIPVIPFVGNWSAKLAGCPLGKYHTSADAMAQAHIRAYEMHGLDAVNPQSDNYYIAEGFGVKVKIMENETPIVVSTPLASIDDVDTLRAPDPYKDGRMPVYLEAIQKLHDALGEKVIIRAPGTGSFSMAGHLMGTDNFIMTLAIAEVEEDLETQEKLQHLLDISTTALIDFATACVKCGATFLQNGDSLSSINMTSPAVFRKYALPHQKRFFETMNKLKKAHEFATFLHVCGDNTLVAEDMMTNGCDVIEVDYACDLQKYVELSKKTGTCLMGNLNPAGSLLFGTPDDVYRDAMETLTIAGQDRYFILGSGCEVSMDTPLENVKAMITASRDFCK